MAGSFAYVWKDRTQTTTQKIIQARMIAQGATILLILGAGWIYSTGPQVRLLRAVSRPSRWLVRLTTLTPTLFSLAGAEARRPLMAISSAFLRLYPPILFGVCAKLTGINTFFHRSWRRRRRRRGRQTLPGHTSTNSPPSKTTRRNLSTPSCPIASIGQRLPPHFLLKKS